MDFSKLSHNDINKMTQGYEDMSILEKEVGIESLPQFGMIPPREEYHLLRGRYVKILMMDMILNRQRTRLFDRMKYLGHLINENEEEEINKNENEEEEKDKNENEEEEMDKNENEECLTNDREEENYTNEDDGEEVNLRSDDEE